MPAIESPRNSVRRRTARATNAVSLVVNASPTLSPPERRHSNEPGIPDCRSNVIGQAPGWPPGWNARVFDDVTVERIENTVSGERTNDDPRTPLESGDG